MATNEHGLDARYFKEKLGQLVRDAEHYSPAEMELALTRLAKVTHSTESVFDPYAIHTGVNTDE